MPLTPSPPPERGHDDSLDVRLARADGLHPPRPLAPVDRERFLSEAHVAVLSVAGDAERPPTSVPLWYAYEPGGDILVNTSASSRKARLIRAAGAATITVQRGTPPYRYVVVEGQVVDAVHPSPIQVRRAIARRYLSVDGADAALDRYDPADQVLFVIRPQRWHSADFSGAPTRTSGGSPEPTGPAHPTDESGANHDQ